MSTPLCLKHYIAIRIVLVRTVRDQLWNTTLFRTPSSLDGRVGVADQIVRRYNLQRKYSTRGQEEEEDDCSRNRMNVRLLAEGACRRSIRYVFRSLHNIRKHWPPCRWRSRYSCAQFISDQAGSLQQVGCNQQRPAPTVKVCRHSCTLRLQAQTACALPRCGYPQIANQPDFGIRTTSC